MTNQCHHGHLARVCELCEKDAELERLREQLEGAFIAGYYCAGYTNDRAYAEKMAAEYIATINKGEGAA